MSLRSNILSCSFKLFPFSLKGDAIMEQSEEAFDVSCVINFFGRISLLEGILFSLAEQDLPKERFEVILVEDRGGTPEGREIAQRFASLVTIRYFALPENYGLMGYSRNYGLSRARGRYILFLDDDTIILQRDFLLKLVREFEASNSDCIVPRAFSSFYVVKGRYGFLDSYFPANRCTAYSRAAIRDLGGFVSSIIGQEDVEFVIRFIASGRSAKSAPHLEFFHPPLLLPNLRKPKAVGRSFYQLKSRYPTVVWLLLLMNCARHAPLCLIPTRKYQEMGRFGLGFLLGVVMSPFKTEGFRYN